MLIVIEVVVVVLYTQIHRICNHVDYSREALIQQSSVKEVLFREALRKAEEALGLQCVHNVEQLVIKMGGAEHVVEPAKRLLAEFQVREGVFLDSSSPYHYWKNMGADSSITAATRAINHSLLYFSFLSNGFIRDGLNKE